MAVAHKCRDTIKTYFDTYVVEMRNNDGRYIEIKYQDEYRNIKDAVFSLKAGEE